MINILDRTNVMNKNSVNGRQELDLSSSFTNFGSFDFGEDSWTTIHDTVNMNTALKYTHYSAAVDNIQFRVTFRFLGNSSGPITTFFKISTVNGL